MSKWATAWVEGMIWSLVRRGLAVFLVIHLGLLAGVYGLATLPPEAADARAWLGGGLAGVYGGIWLGLVFIALPFVRLARLVRRILRWREWVLEELPKLLVLLPPAVEAIRAAFGNRPASAPRTSAASETEASAERVD